MAFQSLVTGLAIIACSLLLRAFGKGLRRFVYLTSKIPGPTLWQTATVHAKHLLGDNMVLYTCKLCDLYNYKPWGTWLADLSYLIFVSDCESMSAVSKISHKPDLIYKPFIQIMGRNLLTMNGPQYPEYRKMFGSALRKSLLDQSMPRMAEPMSELVEELRERASTGKDVDLRYLTRWYTLKLSVASLMSNTHPNANHVMQVTADAVNLALELIQLKTMNPVYYWLFVRWKSSSRRTMALINAALAGFDDIIDNKCQLVSTEDTDIPDSFSAFVLWFLKRVHHEDNDEQLRKELRILFLASFDTTGFVMNCLLLVLALHQDVQQRVCDEIDSVIGEKEEAISAEDLERLMYMETVIKETLRLYPAVPILGRSVLGETNINGILAPKGSIVMMNVIALHRNPEYFPDPLKFDPNRFSPEASKKLRSHSYIPFSDGFRKCPGQLHAFVMLKIILCHVLRNFRILPGSKLKSLNDIKFKTCFTMKLQESSLRLVDRNLEKKKVQCY